MLLRGGVLQMNNSFISFIVSMFAKDGKICAPQVTGFLMCIFGCVLAALNYDSNVVIPIFTAATALLGVSGTLEVYASKRDQGKE